MERVAGIEPVCPAWEAGVLPLNYTRLVTVFYCIFTFDFTVALTVGGDLFQLCLKL